MSKPSAFTISAALIGLAAGTLAFGTVHIALGKELVTTDKVGRQTATVNVQQSVNRAGKSDRLAVNASREAGTTLIFSVPSMPDTLVVTRFPDKADANTPRHDGNAARPMREKRAVACEPSVSVLTDVAKLLGASRCVT